MSKSVWANGSYTPLNTATEYANPQADSDASATESNEQHVMVMDGVLSNLRVNFAAAAGAGKSWVVTVRLNATTVTALTVTISGASEVTDNDLTNRVRVVRGDLVSVSIVPSGTPTSAVIHWSIVFDGDQARQSQCLISTTTAAAGTDFKALQGVDGDTVEANERCPMPVAGTFKRLRVNLAAALGVGNSVKFVLRKAGADSALVVTLSDTDVEEIIDADVAAAVGDVFTFSTVITAGTPAATRFYAALVFEATTDGQFLMVMSTDGAPSTSANNFVYAHRSGSSWNATETARDQWSDDYTVQAIAAVVTTPPGTGNSWLFAHREATVTQLSVTLSDAEVADQATGSAAVAAGELIGTLSTPTNTPDATTGVAVVVGCFIQPTGSVDEIAALTAVRTNQPIQELAEMVAY